MSCPRDPISPENALARRAGGQLFLLDREDLAGLDLDAAHQAGAPAGVRELGVIAAGLDPGDAKPLIVIDGAVLVVLALIGAEARGARWRQIEFGDRVARQVPE